MRDARLQSNGMNLDCQSWRRSSAVAVASAQGERLTRADISLAADVFCVRGLAVHMLSLAKRRL
jgi:hypothetical protein